GGSVLRHGHQVRERKSLQLVGEGRPGRWLDEPVAVAVRRMLQGPQAPPTRADLGVSARLAGHGSVTPASAWDVTSRSRNPVSGLEASAVSRSGARPARTARRPASTPRANARAMAAGSRATAMAV